MKFFIDCTIPESLAFAAYMSGFLTCSIIHFFTVDLPNRKAWKEQDNAIKSEQKSRKVNV